VAMPQQLIVVPQRNAASNHIMPPHKNTKKLVLWKNVGLANAREGIENYERVNGDRLGTESWDVLCKPHGDAMPSSDLWDEFQEVEERCVRFESNHPLPVDLLEVEKLKAMEFRADAYLTAPDDLFSHNDGSVDTRLKTEYKHLFEHSASSSFLAFLPLSFWRTVVDNTNLHAKQDKQPNLTLEELMVFLGILFYMASIDKGEYANYWGKQVENKLFNEVPVGLDGIMTLRRFKFIRRNLSFRDVINAQDRKVDPAARIRPLINILKLRCPRFVDLGRNVAVDESSIASRSKYARDLIVYNATKPTGKYHFKIYMCCCSTTWYAVNFKLHCASGIGARLGGVIDQEEIVSHELGTKMSSEVRKHVLEVTIPIHMSRRIVNTDNFYTSCQLLEALRVKGLYCRGTIRENSKLGPKSFMLSKKDKMPRGTLRQGVDIKHKIIGASWSDGSIVNILSNADDSSITSVTRRIGRTKVAFKAPTCIREYNKAMQGVDRIDQVRARFSAADGHTFKKWHIKLAMAYIDIARCNAYIARKMSCASLNARDSHRQFLMDLSSELMSGQWQHAVGDTGLLFSAPPGATSTLVTATPRTASPSIRSVECRLTNSQQIFPSSRTKRECVVCRFEGRYASEKTVFCSTHNVSLCTRIYSAVPPHSYTCPDSSLTCLAKFHTFYHPAGLFNVNGHIRRSCKLFKEKKDQEARSRAPNLSTLHEEIETVDENIVEDIHAEANSYENVSVISSQDEGHREVPFQDYVFGEKSDTSFDYEGSIPEHSDDLEGTHPVRDHNLPAPSNDQAQFDYQPAASTDLQFKEGYVISL